MMCKKGHAMSEIPSVRAGTRRWFCAACRYTKETYMFKVFEETHAKGCWGFCGEYAGI